jgi:CRP-like cAMP-binding protein
MDNRLLKLFSNIAPLEDEEIAAIDATMTVHNYYKGTLLLKEGQISTEAYFVLEGIVRQYYVIDGEEKTSDFFTDEQWVISIQAINHFTPSTHYLECATDCTILVGNSAKGEELYQKFPKLGTISRKLMEKIFSDQQEKIAAFTINTPEIRYQNLVKSRPDLFQRVPQYQIASYIGVTPESLSRIRKRIINKN